MMARASIQFKDYIRLNQVSNISRSIGRLYQIIDFARGFLVEKDLIDPDLMVDIFSSTGITEDLDMYAEADAIRTRDVNRLTVENFLRDVIKTAEGSIVYLEGVLESHIESGGEISFSRFSEYRSRTRELNQ